MRSILAIIFAFSFIPSISMAKKSSKWACPDSKLYKKLCKPVKWSNSGKKVQMQHIKTGKKVSYKSSKVKKLKRTKRIPRIGTAVQVSCDRDESLGYCPSKKTKTCFVVDKNRGEAIVNCNGMDYQVEISSLYIYVKNRKTASKN